MEIIKVISVIIIVVFFGCTEKEKDNDDWFEEVSVVESPGHDVEYGDILYFKLDSSPHIVNYIRSKNLFDCYYLTGEGTIVDIRNMKINFYFKEDPR